MRKKLLAAALTLAGTAALMGTTTETASARVGAPWVGWGQTNNTHAVWCVQKLINDSPTPFHLIAEDGLFGNDTYNAIRAFQTWASNNGWNTGGIDGTVGPRTGWSLLESFNDYYDGYCRYYLPTIV